MSISRQIKKNNESYDNPITEGIIWKQLLIFFFPIMFGTMFQQIYNIADTIVVGQCVGTDALAAVGGSVFQLVNIVIGFFVGLSSGAAVTVSQAFGAGKNKILSDNLHTAITFAVIFGLIIGMLGFCLTDWMLAIMNTPSDSVKLSAQYLHIYYCGIIFSMIYNMGASMLRAVGDSKRPLFVLIISCILNVILDIILVAVFKLGIPGVAIGTVASQALSAVIILVMLFNAKQECYRLHVNKLRLHGTALKRMLVIGIPAGVESVMYNICNIVIQVFVNSLGTNTVAAWGTLGKIDAFFWMVINAFAISVTTFIGQNYGAGKYDRMRKSVRWTLGMAFGSAIVIILLVVTFAEPIYGIFTKDSDVVNIGMHMTRFLMPTYILFVIIGVLSGALRGVGKVLVPMLLTCGGVCSIRLLWLFCIVSSHKTIEMIMLSYPISWVITAVLFVIYYLFKFPKKSTE